MRLRGTGTAHRRLGVTTAVLLVAGLPTAGTAAPLFLGVSSEPILIVHIVSASAFFAALGIKLLLLGARRRLGRGRTGWKLLVAHAGTLLSGYTLLTGVLVSLDPAWSDQHLAASFWLAVMLTAHARQYARRLRRALSSASEGRPGSDPLCAAVRRLDAATVALLDLSVRKGMSDRELAALLETSPQRVTHSRERAIARLGNSSASVEARLRRLPANAWPAPRRRTGTRLLVVGGGMAGHAVVEEMVRRGNWQITLLAEEDVEPYDRTRLSELLREPTDPERLARRPPDWYAEAGVDLRLRAPATALDLARRRVTDRNGGDHRYDALVLATGSRPFLPQIVGAELAHVCAYRTRRDVATIAELARDARTVVVVGGGLLGLEAGEALRQLGAAVTVIEAADRLMPQQLDAGGAAALARSLARLGLETRVGTSVAAIRQTRVELTDGRELPADVVVLAVGVRAEITLAAKAGLDVGRGVVVDDEMRTSTPGVWAVGECAEHRGVVPGLWSPVLRQARVAAASLAGTPIPFEAAPMQATLKVAELELFVVGRTSSGSADVEFIRSDAHNGDYTKLVLNDERLVGATLLGDTTRAGQLGSLVATGERVPPDVLNARAAGVPEGDLVCSCMQVTRERIRRALEDDAADDLETVSEITGATTGCGSCAGAVTRIVTAHRRLAAVD